MPAPKTITIYGVSARVEAVPGVWEDPQLPADYVLVAESATAQLAYLNDGARQADPRGTGDLPGVGASGRKAAFKLATLTRGQAATALPYAADVLPLDAHALRRMAGWGATFSATAGGTGKPGHTYRPVADGYVTGSVRLFSRGQFYDMPGTVVKSHTISADAAGIVREEFELEGGAKLPVDAAAPNVAAVDVATLPMKFDGRHIAQFITGVADVVVRKWAVKLTRESAERPNGLLPGAHQGFIPGRIACEITATVEALPLSVWNPYQVQEDATVVGLTIPFGVETIAGRRGRLSTASAQLVGVQEAEEKPIATWDLTFKAFSVTGAPDLALVLF